jgi:hypothetical protein
VITALWIGFVFFAFWVGAVWGFGVGMKRAGEMVKTFLGQD